MIEPFFVSAMIADATIEECANMVDKILPELIEVIPDLTLRVQMEGDNRKMVWKGYLLAYRPLGMPDVEYGYCEVRRLNYVLPTPVQICLYSSHQDHIWLWKRLESRLRKSLLVVNNLIDAETRPWLLIPDHLNDRLILELHWRGLTASQIEERNGIPTRTFYDTLRKLRKNYGNKIVPLKRDITINKKS